MLSFSVNIPIEKIADISFMPIHVKNDLVREWLSEIYFKVLEDKIIDFDADTPLAFAVACEQNTQKIKVKRELNIISKEELEVGYDGISDDLLAYKSMTSKDISELEDMLDNLKLFKEMALFHNKISIEEGFDLIDGIKLALQADGYKDKYIYEKIVSRLKIIIEQYELEDLIKPLLMNPDVFYMFERYYSKISDDLQETLNNESSCFIEDTTTELAV